jgi:hypothetical protein
MNFEQRSNVDITIVHNAPNSLHAVRGAGVVRYRLSRGLAGTSTNWGGLNLGEGVENKQQTNKVPMPGCRKNFVFCFFVWFKFDLLVSDVCSAVIT